MPGHEFTTRYLSDVQRIAARLDQGAIETLAEQLASVRERGGRLFILGVGGSAANASHAVNDFRKLAGFEAYAATDNVSELTARINDEGWETSISAWLQGSRLGSMDAIMVFSVGGGDPERGVSLNLVRAVDYARHVGASVFGILGRDGGYAARHADAAVVIPSVNDETVTPHAEAFQAVVWHLLVSHPSLQTSPARWESLQTSS